ncbi:MAG: hypothetical protein ACREGH_02525 [Minisyncoccia bacterium]
MSNKPEPWDLAAGRQIREMLERLVVWGEMSGRTLALMLSSWALRNSWQNGLKLVPPRWGVGKDGRRYWVPLEKEPAFDNTLDADFHFGWGGGIIVRQENGTYAEDVRYKESLDCRLFRRRVMPLLRRIDKTGEIQEALAPIESWKNWRAGLTNVPPLPARVQLHFRGPDGRPKKERCKEALRTAALEGDPVANSISVVDDTDPTGERHILYLVPLNGSKEFALDHILEQLAGAGGAKPRELRVLLAGDRMSDFSAACDLTSPAKVIFLLVGICVEEQLWNGPVDSAYESVASDWEQHARPADLPGFFVYHKPPAPPRTIVRCEVAFPGCRGPEAIRAFLGSAPGKAWLPA